MNNFPLPLFLKDKNFVEPDELSYYLLSADGLFLVKNFKIYRSCTKVEKGLPWLEEQTDEIKLNLPKIPRSIIERVVGFFYVVYRLYKSEAIVFLYFNPKEKYFKIWVPEQEVEVRTLGRYVLGGYHLNYSGVPTPDGFIRVGTIHSHGHMPAYYSWTDEKDSKFDDSLNLVVGDLDRKRPSFAACFMVNGHKFELEPEKVMKHYLKPRFPVPRKWINQVMVK